MDRFCCTFFELLNRNKQRGCRNAEKMQWRADQMAGRGNIDRHRCRDVSGMPASEVCIFDRGIADRGGDLAHQPEPTMLNIHKTKKSRSFHGKRMAFIIRLELDCACNLVGTHASCANVNRFDVTVVFNDFHFLYVGFPFSIRTSTNLGTFNADSMTCHLAFFTNCTFSHCLHLLKPCLCDITKIF